MSNDLFKASPSVMHLISFYLLDDDLLVDISNSKGMPPCWRLPMQTRDIIRQQQVTQSTQNLNVEIRKMIH
jgi:hypothetical protein